MCAPACTAAAESLVRPHDGMLAPPSTHTPAPFPTTIRAFCPEFYARQLANNFNRPLILDTSSVTSMFKMFSSNVCCPRHAPNNPSDLPDKLLVRRHYPIRA